MPFQTVIHLEIWIYFLGILPILWACNILRKFLWTTFWALRNFPTINVILSFSNDLLMIAWLQLKLSHRARRLQVADFLEQQCKILKHYQSLSTQFDKVKKLITLVRKFDDSWRKMIREHIFWILHLIFAFSIFSL